MLRKLALSLVVLCVMVTLFSCTVEPPKTAIEPAILQPSSPVLPEQQVPLNSNLQADSRTQNYSLIPIFDMHAHFQPAVSPEVMIENMKKANVVMATLMPNQGADYDSAKSIVVQYPAQFVAFIGFQNKEWQSQNISFINKVEDALKTEKFKGLGEILVRHYAIPKRSAPDIYIPANSSNVLKLLSLAEKYNVPATIHMEAEDKTVSEFVFALKEHSKAKIIWAHAGRAMASVVNSMLASYPNLYIDIAALETYVPYGTERNRITKDDGTLSDDWMQLLIKYQDRVMTGSDMPFQDMWMSGQYPKIMDSQRDLLKQLPFDVAEKVAFKNAEKLLETKFK